MTYKSLSDVMTDAAEDVTRQCVQRAVPVGHVLHRAGENVNLDRGIRDGYRVGARCIILREVEGKMRKVGEIRISRSYPTDSEGEIVVEMGNIQTGDLVRVLYEPFIGFRFTPSRPDENTVDRVPVPDGG
jgi:hypothetical protein